MCDLEHFYQPLDVYGNTQFTHASISPFHGVFTRTWLILGGKRIPNTQKFLFIFQSESEVPVIDEVEHKVSF